MSDVLHIVGEAEPRLGPQTREPYQGEITTAETKRVARTAQKLRLTIEANKIHPQIKRAADLPSAATSAVDLRSARHV